jgi:hypothetical protein
VISHDLGGAETAKINNCEFENSNDHRHGNEYHS